MAAAITIYLSFRRDEVNAEPAGLMRLAARAEWKAIRPTRSAIGSPTAVFRCSPRLCRHRHAGLDLQQTALRVVKLCQDLAGAAKHVPELRTRIDRH